MITKFEADILTVSWPSFRHKAIQEWQMRKKGGEKERKKEKECDVMEWGKEKKTSKTIKNEYYNRT